MVIDAMVKLIFISSSLSLSLSHLFPQSNWSELIDRSIWLRQHNQVDRRLIWLFDEMRSFIDEIRRLWLWQKKTDARAPVGAPPTIALSIHSFPIYWFIRFRSQMEQKEMDEALGSACIGSISRSERPDQEGKLGWSEVIDARGSASTPEMWDAIETPGQLGFTFFSDRLLYT